MSLRLRLILAFMAIVALMLAVGITSFVVNHHIRRQVADVGSSSGVDLRRVDLSKMGLEFEGHWDPDGIFVARDIEVVPGMRRPRLRGPIQGVDASQRTITLYGVAIQVPEDTEFIEDDVETAPFESLHTGQRVEVTCSVDDGVWTARKIRTHGVKQSDKIKGTITSSSLDGKAPETVELHGLLISLAPSADISPEGALRRIEMATQMTLAVHECRALAHELVLGKPVDRGLDQDLTLDRDARVQQSVSDRLVQAELDFEYYLRQSRMGDGASPGSPSPSVYERWLRPLAERQPLFSEEVETLQGLARTEPEQASAYLEEVFVPFLESDLLPLVYAYLSRAEEELGDQLRSIVSGTNTTTRVALATSAGAAILALTLGILVWRSIHRPIAALHTAALRLGQGHLETRVAFRSRDELGDLAAAFNKMAGDLTTTTVSVANLESVLDSMAGALVILDASERITNVNRAALRLLGYEREDLVGQTFEAICATPKGDTVGPIVRADEGVVAVAEKAFLRKDGTEIPVSFSGAELRFQDGPLQGYVCVAQDLTERKRIEKRVRDSLAEKELLLREIHHRVKNNMQVISSMLAMQSSGTGDPETNGLFEQSQNRIRSMALIHEQLYQSSDFAHIDFRAYLEMLTSRLMQSHGHGDAVGLELLVDDIAIDIDQSLACGLIINELVTNALKHAFSDGRRGAIRVSLTEEPDGGRVLVVADDGRGVAEAFDPGRSESLGMSLVTTLVQQIDGSMTVRGESGTEVRIVFPRGSSKTVRS